MRILITGANGFIAREIIARLKRSGEHEIIACAHNQLFENIPYTSAFKMDFTKAILPQDWLPHLKGVDAVINCVGVFQTATEKTMWNIHYEAPKALFDACLQSESGVKKIIQISALGVDKVKVPYASSKFAIEKYLQSLDIDSVIIRPGLVYGKGAYGGSSLFRALASLPFILPMPGNPKQLQQPIHLDDLTAIVEKALSLPGKELLSAVGEERLSVKDILTKLRTWLGFKKAYSFAMPQIVLRIGAKIGNFIPNAPLSETAIQMMSVDTIASEEEVKNLERKVKLKPRGFTDGLNGMVSSVQDRWHARLYFLRPLLRLSIAFLWIYTGIISLLPINIELNAELLRHMGIASNFRVITYFFSILDILLGLATLFNYRLRMVGTIQCILIVFYILVISLFFPLFWMSPLGAIIKDIPLLVATFFMIALESDR